MLTSSINRLPILEVAPTVAVFDLDRTITRMGTYTPFLMHCVPAHQRTLQRLPMAIWLTAIYASGLISRDDVKARMLDVNIVGASRAQIAAWADTYVEKCLACHVRPGALKAIKAHRIAGHHLVLATASFDFYAQEFADLLGFDHLIATKSAWDERGRLRAALGSENCYGQVKFDAVQEYVAAMIPRPRVVAYSDHHSDVELLRWADEGVAVNPNGRFRRMAVANGFRIADWETK
ncbi:MAG: HAD family hydrolase [Rhodospirillaceae bacterium]